MNLMDMVLNGQNGDVVRQIASGFQLDEGQARSAMGALMPALTRGISREAHSPEGLNDLVGALGRGNHRQYIDNPEVLGQEAAVVEGNGILGHLFGSKEVSRQVASRAAEDSGIDSSILKQMLPVLASAAMGAMSKSGFGDNSAVGRTGSDQGAGIGDLLTSFLDADKDGSAVDDILGMASRFLR